MRPMQIRWICIVTALALFAGCQNSPMAVDASSGAPRQAPPVTELVATSRPPIADMPVPIGFKIDEDKSRDYAPGGGRFVDHTYQGGARKLAVKRFYQRQMPVSRWTLTMAKYVRGEISLDYEKEAERCRITISDGGLFHKTSIRLEVWTSGRLQTPGNP